MKVRDVMTRAAFCCFPEMNVGATVELMWAYLNHLFRFDGLRRGPSLRHRSTNLLRVTPSTEICERRHCFSIQQNKIPIMRSHHGLFTRVSCYRDDDIRGTLIHAGEGIPPQ
jgi:hypothetical protein